MKKDIYDEILEKFPPKKEEDKIKKQKEEGLTEQELKAPEFDTHTNQEVVDDSPDNIFDELDKDEIIRQLKKELKWYKEQYREVNGKWETTIGIGGFLFLAWFLSFFF